MAFFAVLAACGWGIATFASPGRANPPCDKAPVAEHNPHCASTPPATTTVTTSVTTPGTTVTTTAPGTTATTTTSGGTGTGTTGGGGGSSPTATISAVSGGSGSSAAQGPATKGGTAKRSCPTTSKAKAKTKVVTLYKKRVVRVRSKKLHRYVKQTRYLKVRVRVPVTFRT